MGLLAIEALPVLWRIRRDVPRPGVLPKPCQLEFSNGTLRWNNCCPMGLHPKSKQSCPTEGRSFADGSYPDIAVYKFATWWDSQTDPKEAVDAIWNSN